MTAQDVREFVRHNKMGVLALTKDRKAYAVPLFYGYDGRDFFFQGRPGLKDEFVEATDEACFTIVRARSLDDWASAQVFGRLERVPRASPTHALMSVPLPPAWGESEVGEPTREEEDIIVYRLAPTRTSGRYSEAATEAREDREMVFSGM